MSRIFNDITETIGNTPLVRVNRLNTVRGVTVLVKLEFFNPLSSVKDRLGLALIEDAERKGLISAGATIIESTSGNTGIGLACVCAAKGYKAVITMPENMSVERIKLLKILGAEVVLTEAAKGIPGAIEKAEELHKKIPGSYMAQQFKNPANPEVHRRTTAEEIWKILTGQLILSSEEREPAVPFQAQANP
jgi:cysteine synthase A